MTLGKLTVGVLLGFSSTSLYYNKERKSDINAVIECEKAWQKYHSITVEKNTFEVLNIESINKELKKFGIDLSREQTEFVVKETLKHGMDYVPVVGPLIKKIIKNQLAPSKKAESDKWYKEEVIPKCRKIRDWQKEMEKMKLRK